MTIGRRSARRTVLSAYPFGAAGMPSPAAGAVSLFVLVSVILVLVFLLGTFVLVRNARRRRATAERQPPAPTSADDVWAMHKLPEEDDRAEPDAQDRR